MDILMLVKLSVPYDEWKAVFDGDRPDTVAFAKEVTVAQVDDETAMVLSFDVDMEAQARYMSEPENAARIASVAEGHTIYSLTELSPPA